MKQFEQSRNLTKRPKAPMQRIQRTNSRSHSRSHSRTHSRTHELTLSPTHRRPFRHLLRVPSDNDPAFWRSDRRGRTGYQSDGCSSIPSRRFVLVLVLVLVCLSPLPPYESRIKTWSRFSLRRRFLQMITIKGDPVGSLTNGSSVNFDV